MTSTTHILLNALEYRPLHLEVHEHSTHSLSSLFNSSDHQKLKFVKRTKHPSCNAPLTPTSYRSISASEFFKTRSLFSSSSQNKNNNTDRFDFPTKLDQALFVTLLVCSRSMLNSTAPRVISTQALFPHLRKSIARLLLDYAPTVRYTYSLIFNQLNDDFLETVFEKCCYVQNIDFNYIFNKAYKIDLTNAFERLHPKTLETIRCTGIDSYHLLLIFGLYAYGGPHQFKLVSSKMSNSVSSSMLPPLQQIRLTTLEINNYESLTSESIVRVLDELCIIRKVLRTFILECPKFDFNANNSGASPMIDDFLVEFIGQKVMRLSSKSSLRKLHFHIPIRANVSVEGARRLFHYYSEPLKGGYLDEFQDEQNNNNNNNVVKNHDDHIPDHEICCLSELSIETTSTIHHPRMLISDDILDPVQKRKRTNTSDSSTPVHFPFLQKLHISIDGHQTRDRVQFSDNSGLRNLFENTTTSLSSFSMFSYVRSIRSLSLLKNNLQELVLMERSWMFHERDDSNVGENQHVLTPLKELFNLRRLALVNFKLLTLVGDLGENTTGRKKCFLPTESLEELEITDMTGCQKKKQVSTLFECLGNWFESDIDDRKDNDDDDDEQNADEMKKCVSSCLKSLRIESELTAFHSHNLSSNQHMKLESKYFTKDLIKIKSLERLRIVTSEARHRMHERNTQVQKFLAGEIVGKNDEFKKMIEETGTFVENYYEKQNNNNKISRAKSDKNAANAAATSCWVLGDDDFDFILEEKDFKEEVDLLFKSLPKLVSVVLR